jgi:hypothetical protein
MSSVIIAGNTSGTITLDAPAVAGTTVLTLPTTSGTVLLKDSNNIVSVSGIQFPATQSASADANTLDDYEEGTFTPTVLGISTAGTTTYTTQNGHYTKIGRVVTVAFKVSYSAATGTGALAVRGFPFAGAGASAEYIGSVMIDNLDAPNAGSYSIYLNGGAGGTGIEVYSSTDNASLLAFQLTNETASIWGTITYFSA